jgi:ketosteroid isomerase-like protein
MRNILVILFTCIQPLIYAQPFTPQQQEVINAENSFAALSKSTNFVDAFMAYLSDSTIMFDQTTPVLGINLYKDRSPDKSLLFWWPVFIGVSADGKMGFSTGPWEWSKNRDTLPQAFGYYVTLWEKNREGHWKMGVDLGIQYADSQRTNPSLKASPTPDQKGKSGPISKKQLMEMDSSYSSLLRDPSRMRDYFTPDGQLLRSANPSYIKEYFTSDGHLLRSGYRPYASPAEFDQHVEDRMYSYWRQDGGGVSGSNDLFYVYGRVSSNTADGRTTGNKYFRVWKKENNKWKIILDVISSDR